MTVRIAVNGCCHGELGRLYQELEYRNETPELLIICGDFQAVRNARDLDSMAVPNKYKQEGDFSGYYDGRVVAPVLTIIIGGNHESSRFLKEYPYGGWVAPNIYYMGYTNVVWFKGIRIGGVSGIFNEHHFMTDRVISQTFKPLEIRSVYHVRRSDLMTMLMLGSDPLDVMVSHDWPQGIEAHGNLPRLLRTKPYFRKDVETGKLGNPALRVLMGALRPALWFAAHLHVYYEAEVEHPEAAPHTRALKRVRLGHEGGDEGPGITSEVNADEIDLDLEDTPKVNADEIDLDLEDTPKVNTDEIDLDLEDTPKVNADEIDLDLEDTPKVNADEIDLELEDTPEVNADEIDLDLEVTPEIALHATRKQPTSTRFFALDKIIPRRTFLKVMDVPIGNPSHISAGSSFQLYYDAEYVAVLRVLKRLPMSKLLRHYTSIDLVTTKLSLDSELLSHCHKEVALERLNLQESSMEVLPNFSMTEDSFHTACVTPPAKAFHGFTNPHTIEFLQRFGL